MAYVQKRELKSGAAAYVVKWKTPDGRQRSKGGFRTRRDARAFATKVEAELLVGGDHAPGSGKVLFRDAAAEWLKSREGDLKSTTLAEHRGALAPAATRRGDAKTLGIDAEFGGYPLNKITRRQVQAWVNKFAAVGKKPPTVRYQYYLVRMVLAQAVVDKRLAANPTDGVNLPGGRRAKADNWMAVADDQSQFLSAAQVSALVDATPWPYNVLVYLAAWSGLRAGELGGLQVADVRLPIQASSSSAPKDGKLLVRRSVRPLDGVTAYMPTKTGKSREVPIRSKTVEVLREYLSAHPRRDEPTAPLFPDMRLDPPETRLAILAALTVEQVEERLVLAWTAPLRHGPFYQLVFRPAVLRANRLTPTVAISPALKFHGLRHSYASLCVAAGLSTLRLSRYMGHGTSSVTEKVYTHLFADNHADAMAALDALESNPTEPQTAGKVLAFPKQA